MDTPPRPPRGQRDPPAQQQHHHHHYCHGDGDGEASGKDVAPVTPAARAPPTTPSLRRSGMSGPPQRPPRTPSRPIPPWNRVPSGSILSAPPTRRRALAPMLDTGVGEKEKDELTPSKRQGRTLYEFGD